MCAMVVEQVYGRMFAFAVRFQDISLYPIPSAQRYLHLHSLVAIALFFSQQLHIPAVGSWRHRSHTFHHLLTSLLSPSIEANRIFHMAPRHRIIESSLNGVYINRYIHKVLCSLSFLSVRTEKRRKQKWYSYCKMFHNMIF